MAKMTGYAVMLLLLSTPQQRHLHRLINWHIEHSFFTTHIIQPDGRSVIVV